MKVEASEVGASTHFLQRNSRWRQLPFEMTPDQPIHTLDLEREFESFVAKYVSPVRKLAISRIGPSRADDVVSDVFIAAWELQQTAGATATTLPWLLAVTVNKCRMAARAESAWLRRLARGQILVANGWTDAFEDALVDRVDATAVHGDLLSAFSQLSAQERDVMTLVAWAELSPTEVAEALDMPTATVRSHLHRARHRMATALDIGEQIHRASEEITP